MPVIRLYVPRRRQRHRRVRTESDICTMLRNGPFWMLAGAVLVLFFSSIGAVLVCVGRFRLHWGRFGNRPFWSVPISTGPTGILMSRVRFQVTYCNNFVSKLIIHCVCVVTAASFVNKRYFMKFYCVLAVLKGNMQYRIRFVTYRRL